MLLPRIGEGGPFENWSHLQTTQGCSAMYLIQRVCTANFVIRSVHFTGLHCTAEPGLALRSQQTLEWLRTSADTAPLHCSAPSLVCSAQYTVESQQVGCLHCETFTLPQDFALVGSMQWATCSAAGPSSSAGKLLGMGGDGQ